MTQEEIAQKTMQSEAMLWLCTGANHQDMWLRDLRKMYEAWIKAGGKHWGKPE